jgi:hypothetical protein
MNSYFTPRLCRAVVGGFLILSGLLLLGCASSRVLKRPLPPTQADVGWTAAAPEGLTVEVHQLIFRNSGGSWVRDANWDEYVLIIKNDSQDIFEIHDINLYSDKLPAPVESSTSREQLDARSNSTLRALKDVGIVGGVGVVAPSALIIGGVGTSGGILSASTAGAAAAAIGVVAIPVGLIGGTVYVINRHRRDSEDKVLIDRTLKERGFALPLQIPPGMQLEKSVFFPVTPAPTRLIVSETTGGNAGEISVDLSALAQLHLKPPSSAHPVPSG